MFTKRFIKLPIKVYNSDFKDMTGEEVCDDTYTMVNPFTIARYRPSNENDGNCVHITFKDSDCILAYMNIREFEKLVNRYSDISNNMP